MKIKTAELTGPALCYALCLIHMPHLVWGKTIGLHHASHQIVVPELKEPNCYSPFMSWDMLMPMIDLERMTLEGHNKEWQAIKFHDERPWTKATGPTRLIAAARCLVAIRLGDEIEVPGELA